MKTIQWSRPIIVLFLVLLSTKIYGSSSSEEINVRELRDPFERAVLSEGNVFALPEENLHPLIQYSKSKKKIYKKLNTKHLKHFLSHKKQLPYHVANGLLLRGSSHLSNLQGLVDDYNFMITLWSERSKRLRQKSGDLPQFSFLHYFQRNALQVEALHVLIKDILDSPTPYHKSYLRYEGLSPEQRNPLAIKFTRKTLNSLSAFLRKNISLIVSIYEERWENLNNLHNLVIAHDMQIPESIEWQSLKEKAHPAVSQPLVDALTSLQEISANLKSLPCKMKEFKELRTHYEGEPLEEANDLTSTSSEQIEDDSEEEKELSPRMRLKRTFSVKALRMNQKKDTIPRSHATPSTSKRGDLSPRELPKRKAKRKQSSPPKIATTSIPHSIEDARSIQRELHKEITDLVTKTNQLRLDISTPEELIEVSPPRHTNIPQLQNEENLFSVIQE
ncbi:hypothetical protein [Candidatus Nucleicultrix amoebiphila]|jgi:hypothetical protein|uniref:Uncharacterized protein n=1 Tax=Candidatus Nucleicultrix amoebiphila FS5 TaxID=1414854 RepID=A0A1W6N5N8_9PROT|nr:hypothetical protein [Candidatus Nucleicultrix amoebiphila]ARN85167.1 hypothetical protein GQ61_07585 [Candidatus Nucleicultrix amoebiphila FS5]